MKSLQCTSAYLLEKEGDLQVEVSKQKVRKDWISQRNGKVIMAVVSVLNLQRRTLTAMGCWQFCWAMWDTITAFAEYLSSKNFKRLHRYSATGNRRKRAEEKGKYSEKTSTVHWNQRPWCSIVENCCVKPATKLISFLDSTLLTN